MPPVAGIPAEAAAIDDIASSSASLSSERDSLTMRGSAT